MVFPHTHVQVDGLLHLIHTVEDHPDGPRHSHRAHLGCGLTVDTDFGGEKHARQAGEQRARAAEAKGRRYGEVEHAQALEAAAHLDASSLRHHADHADPKGRWRQGGSATCLRCSAVESGSLPLIVDHGHNAPTTVHADIPTGIRCPQCDSTVLKRHHSKPTQGFACSGQGHEFTEAELLAHMKKGLETLLSL